MAETKRREEKKIQKTNIEWVKNPDGSQGYTWNPITGCLNGCPYCYARKLANGRLRHLYLWNPTNIPEPSFNRLDPFYPRFWASRLQDVDRVSPYYKPKGIFVCDMSDLFGIGIPDEWTWEVLAHIKNTPYDRFYLLTKQPQNLIKFSPFPDNCWVGATATGREMYLKATGADGLDGIEAKVKYISFEPLLEAIHPSEYRLKGIDWVIIGAQTNPYKPPKWEWVFEIIDACVNAGIPYFLKNNLGKVVPKVFGGEGELLQEIPA